MKRLSKIKKEIVVGIDDETDAALALATAFFQTSVSQYARQKLVEGLVRDGLLQHPIDKLRKAAKLNPINQPAA
jgi:hypothetical protein